MRHAEHKGLIVAWRPVGPFAMNSYVVGCTETGTGAIVDSGGDEDVLLAWAEAQGLRIEKLLQTHGHIDHIAGLGPMKDRTKAPIFLHPGDRMLYDTASMQGRMFGLQINDPPPVDTALAEGDTVELGALTFAVLHTPGHCPGHVVFHEATAQVLFAGDLLFRGSIGRTDLPGGDTGVMMRSLARVTSEIPADTVVYPGHMEPTTIGYELRTNPFLTR